MRVRISYGVKLDLIPELTKKQIDGVLSPLREKIERLQHNTDLLSMAGTESSDIAGHISAQIVKDISELRSALLITDQTLADFVAILDGYAAVSSSDVEFVEDAMQPLAAEVDNE
jgi:hypothetical protein